MGAGAYSALFFQPRRYRFAERVMCLPVLWDQGVYPHFCDARKSPCCMWEVGLWENLFVVSLKWSFPTAMVCSYDPLQAQALHCRTCFPCERAPKRLKPRIEQRHGAAASALPQIKGIGREGVFKERKEPIRNL